MQIIVFIKSALDPAKTKKKDTKDHPQCFLSIKHVSSADIFDRTVFPVVFNYNDCPNGGTLIKGQNFKLLKAPRGFMHINPAVHNKLRCRCCN